MLTDLTRRFPWLAGMIDFAFPPLCLGCGTYCDDESHICPRCRTRIIPLDFPICLVCEKSLGDNVVCPNCREDGLPLFAFGQYSDPLTEIVLQFKFKGITSPAYALGLLLAEAHRELLERVQCDYLVPVPLHPGREYRRGYNQALLIAKRVGEILSVPVESELLSRTKKRHPQSRLSFSHRAANIRGVFSLDGDVPPGRALIVDDVVTSGSTVSEVRRVLEEGGAKVVGVLALAYGGGAQ